MANLKLVASHTEPVDPDALEAFKHLETAEKAIAKLKEKWQDAGARARVRETELMVVLAMDKLRIYF